MQIRYDFTVSDLLLRVETPREVQIPDNFKPFRTENAVLQNPDIILQFLFQPTDKTSDGNTGTLRQKNANQNFCNWETFSLNDGEYILRYDPSGRGSPCRIFVPLSFADTFCKNGNWLMYMGIERLMLPFDRFFLHASAVIYQGKAYLFSTKSGGGKSTHAALWQQHFGAKLLNGDKVLIHVRDGQCMAYGSPVAGTSGIYENEGAPIAGIFLLKKSTQNSLATVPPRTAMLSLYSEAIKCSQDRAFNSRLLDLIEKLRVQVPVLSLACLPEKSAVECVLQNNERMTL